MAMAMAVMPSAAVLLQFGLAPLGPTNVDLSPALVAFVPPGSGVPPTKAKPAVRMSDWGLRMYGKGWLKSHPEVLP